MRKSAVLCALLLAATAAAAAKPRSLNWRMKKRKPVAVSTAAASGEQAPPAAVEVSTTLMAGRWSPEVRAALAALIAAKGKYAPSYDPKNPPVAVLPWSDAAVAGDPAELVFLRLVTQAKFRVDDDWWEIVPIVYGRQPARAAYEQFVSLSTSVWASQPAYDAWRKAMLSSYVGQCRGVGRKECRSYLARLMAGYRVSEAEDYAKRALDDEKKNPGTTETVRGEPGDPQPLRVRRGLRLIPEMRDLAAKLLAAGFDVWVVDDVPQPVLTVSAADYGVDPSRVYGVRSSTEGVRMGAGVMVPVPTRGGKADVVHAELGRPADLVLGRDGADFDVMAYGDGLRVAFDGDPELVKKAKERGWPVQKAFAR